MQPLQVLEIPVNISSPTKNAPARFSSPSKSKVVSSPGAICERLSSAEKRREENVARKENSPTGGSGRKVRQMKVNMNQFQMETSRKEGGEKSDRKMDRALLKKKQIDDEKSSKAGTHVAHAKEVRMFVLCDL